MPETRQIMGMPIALEIVDAHAAPDLAERVFSHFSAVDQQFSTYKADSEISCINRGEIPEGHRSALMQKVITLAEQTTQQTNGYFDIHRPDGSIDPSGLVKGWAIQNAAQLLTDAGAKHFYIEAGGDIASQGLNAAGNPWSVGIRNPFDLSEIVKVIYPRGSGVATSGTYIRGQHIYNPHAPHAPITDIKSLTIIGPNILEADRFATAAFAMGKNGIAFIEQQPDLEGYLIDSRGMATMTSGFNTFTAA